MKAFILSWTIPPAMVGSSVTVNNLANYLGDDVVLCGERSEGDLRDWNINYEIIYLKNVFRSVRFGNTLRWLLLPYHLISVLWTLRRLNPRHLIAVFPNAYYCTLVYLVSLLSFRKMSIWMHNTYVENAGKYHKPLAVILQWLFFHRVVNIFLISESLKYFYEESYHRFSKKLKLLTHSFDEKIIFDSSSLNISKNDVINISLTGSINESCLDSSLRCCGYFFNNKKYNIHLFGGNSDLLKQYGYVGKNFIYHGFLPENEFYGMLKSMDFHLLPHGFSGRYNEIEYKTIFPTRTIPLLGSGVPIIAHLPGNCGLNSFLKINNLAYLVNTKNMVEFGIEIENAVNDSHRKSEIVINALNKSREFDSSLVARSLLSVI